MRIVLGRDPEVAAWAGQRLGRRMGSFARAFVPPYIAIGVAPNDADELVGAIIFNGYTGPDIEVTLAGDHCWTKAVIRWAFRYVFGELGCDRVTFTLRAGRPDHEAMARRLGFVREGVARRKFGNDDGILMGMLRDECRWL